MTPYRIIDHHRSITFSQVKKIGENGVSPFAYICHIALKGIFNILLTDANKSLHVATVKQQRDVTRGTVGRAQSLCL